MVILDNLCVHEQTPTRRAFEEVGCQVVFLLTRTLDRKPIEQAFAKIKQLLRRAQARTSEALSAAIARAPTLVTTGDAAGFFHGCDYRPP